MEKTFNITLDIAKPIDPANALNFFRGDSVVFNFTYQNDGEAFDTSSATKLRVYAKAIGANGIVTAEETPLFAAEVATINTVSFSSSSTAGNAGNYLMAVVLLDANNNVITAQAIFLNLIENGYDGIYQPGEDFRDEVLDALSQAQAAAQQAQTSETNAAASATEAQASVTQAQASVTQAQGFAQAAQASQAAAAQSATNQQRLEARHRHKQARLMRRRHRRRRRLPRKLRKRQTRGSSRFPSFRMALCISIKASFQAQILRFPISRSRFARQCGLILGAASKIKP